MSLINLALIKELHETANRAKAHVWSKSFNWGGPAHQISNDALAGVMKFFFQVENLVEQLSELHEECTDIATYGRSKVLERMGFDREYSESSDPFTNLEEYFNEAEASALPSTIEQYEELLGVANQYITIKAKKRENYEEFFGEKWRVFLPGDFEEDEKQENLLLPPLNIDEDEHTRRLANEEIKEVQVEYCLDNYNAFYDQCTALIERHRASGDIQTCAGEILKLYK